MLSNLMVFVKNNHKPSLQIERSVLSFISDHETHEGRFELTGTSVPYTTVRHIGNSFAMASVKRQY